MAVLQACILQALKAINQRTHIAPPHIRIKATERTLERKEVVVGRRLVC